MKRIIAILTVVFSLIGASAYAGTVTIISPEPTAITANPIPEPFLKKISLVGNNLTLRSAFGMLTRITDIPIIVTDSANVKTTVNDYYFIHKPLYMVLNALVKDNGYAYKYKRGEIRIYGLISKTFRLPVNNLDYSFSAATGEGSSGASGGTPSPAPATGSSSSGTPSPAPAASSSMPSTSSSGGVSANPGGSIGGSMSINKTELHYIRRALKGMISKQGKFNINPVLGIVYVKDTPGNIKKIGAYLRLIKKNMVLAVYLKVKVLEVTLNGSNQFGINWNAVFNEAFKANPAGLSAVTIGANLATGAGITSGSPSIEFSDTSGANSALLTALASQGKVNAVSTPTLMLLNGETRAISDNGISSYVQSVVTTTSGLTSSSTYPMISQIQTGLSISFTPHINVKTGIITVTVNFLDNDITGYNTFNIGGNSFENPIIDSKTLTDTVRVKNNHTVIMGGILTTSDSKQTYGVPLLSSIPILGSLFTGVNDATGKSDLIIMITPRIVKL